MGERFSTVLFVEGTPTGDGRQALPDSIVWADPPLPLTWERQSAHSGQAMAEGAIPVGNILTIERVGAQIVGTGELFDASEVEEVEDLLPLLRVPEGMDRCALGVSVELDDVTATVDVIEEDSDGFPVDVMETIESARLRAATIVTTPAFVECTITLLGEMPAADMPPEPPVDDMPAMVAAALPADAFRNPGLTVPTALTITDDGRVYGHLYDSPDQCHLSYAGQCVTPPDEHDLSLFHRGQALSLDDGSQIIPGRLTFHGGHADLNLPAREAKRFYDDPTLPGATVVAGFDPELGLTWFSGLIDPDVTEAQVAKFRSIGQVSGDWRPSDDGTHLNLIAVGLVPVPGFPVRRSRVADGRLTALVAAGPRPLSAADRIARLESAVAALTASAAGTDAVARLLAPSAAENLRTRHPVLT